MTAFESAMWATFGWWLLIPEFWPMLIVWPSLILMWLDLRRKKRCADCAKTLTARPTLD